MPRQLFGRSVFLRMREKSDFEQAALNSKKCVASIVAWIPFFESVFFFDPAASNPANRNTNLRLAGCQSTGV